MIICMFCLYQLFMQPWVGTKLMLSDFNMMLICIYFYAINMNNSRNLYVNGNGLWWKLKIWYVLEAIGNLVLNVLFGYIMGITGIILATIITIIVFDFILRTIVLFREYFTDQCVGRFFGEHFFYFTITILNCAFCAVFVHFIDIGNVWLIFSLKAAVLCVCHFYYIWRYIAKAIFLSYL